MGKANMAMEKPKYGVVQIRVTLFGAGRISGDPPEKRSVVPAGLAALGHLNPPLKWWAIITSPYGTKGY